MGELRHFFENIFVHDGGCHAPYPLFYQFLPLEIFTDDPRERIEPLRTVVGGNVVGGEKNAAVVFAYFPKSAGLYPCDVGEGICIGEVDVQGVGIEAVTLLQDDFVVAAVFEYLEITTLFGPEYRVVGESDNQVLRVVERIIHHRVGIFVQVACDVIGHSAFVAQNDLAARLFVESEHLSVVKENAVFVIDKRLNVCSAVDIVVVGCFCTVVEGIITVHFASVLTILRQDDTLLGISRFNRYGKYLSVIFIHIQRAVFCRGESLGESSVSAVIEEYRSDGPIG